MDKQQLIQHAKYLKSVHSEETEDYALAEIALAALEAEFGVCTDPECHEDFMPVFKEMVARGERVAELEEKLARLREQEPVEYHAEINGIMSSVTKSHYEDCVKYGLKTRKLYADPRPAVLPVSEILKIPRRIEPIGGQRFSYVQLDEVIAILENTDCQPHRFVVKLPAGELVYSSANDSYGAEGCLMLPVSMVVEAIKAAGGQVEEKS